MSSQHNPQEFRYIPCADFWSEAEADDLFDFAKGLPRVREDSKYQGKINGKKRIIGLGSYSISPNTRGLRDGVVNPTSKDIASAPQIVHNVADKLTQLNGGKPINYLSFIAYENQGDHIDWHQHNEDRCRDATVYIISLGEVRTFGLRRVCEKHRVCDKCSENCHSSRKTLCKSCKEKRSQQRGCSTGCKLKHVHYKPCADCETKPSQWKSIQPEHGSVIVLPDSYNRSHEHAILGKQDKGGDKGYKQLRISINTKNIRPEDLLYVERENRSTMAHSEDGLLPSRYGGANALAGNLTYGEDGLIPLFKESIRFPIFSDGAPPKASISNITKTGRYGKPRVWCCRAGSIPAGPVDAVYVGCLTERFPGTVYGNDYEPFKGHKKWIADNEKDFRKYAKGRMKDTAFRAQAIKDLRGRHLLCWCVQDGPKRQKFCHARVWLELVNKP